MWYFFDGAIAKNRYLTHKINYKRVLFRVQKHGNVVIISVVETQIDLMESQKNNSCLKNI